MKCSHLNIGIIHSLIGKNDGVSIVIDQTVNAMVKDMGIGLGNIYYLAAHSSPRFNAQTDDVFWHKSSLHAEIISTFQSEPAPDLDERIHEQAQYAKRKIKDFVDNNSIDLLIAHNTSHPYNFITAVGLGYYAEELRSRGVIWPKFMVWWHDSYFERSIFSNPNDVMKKYLKYLPGTYVDGIAFINNSQPVVAKRYFESFGFSDTELFFAERTDVVPNTSDIPWEWERCDWDTGVLVAPEQDNYNDNFFRDCGLLDRLETRGLTLDDAVILLQHTRIVPRKRIDTALEFAYRLHGKMATEGVDKCVCLLVSGHSGDEQVAYKEFLVSYCDELQEKYPSAKVELIFGEHCILSHRDIIVDKKYYKFAEIPSIVAAHNGMGTYFSDVEGFGNNLLEMMCQGLPVVINKYEVYKTDIEHLNFRLPPIEDCKITENLLEAAFLILTNNDYRNLLVKHNLEILESKLDHRIIAEKIEPLIVRMFTKKLHY